MTVNFGLGCRVATCWIRAAHSIDNMLPLYYDYLCNRWIWALMASVPGLCIHFTCLYYRGPTIPDGNFSDDVRSCEQDSHRAADRVASDSELVIGGDDS